MTNVERWRGKFEARVQKGDGCWLWTGGQRSKGYGRIMLANREVVSAHRFSWLLYRGEIPEGILVCHRCDTPLCVRPDHLFLGTYSDNVRDMLAKRRHPGPVKTHCKRGHLYDESNTRYQGPNRSRYCLACGRLKMSARRLEKPMPLVSRERRGLA